MVRRQQAADRAVRRKLRSPGHPKFQRLLEVAAHRCVSGRWLFAAGGAAVVP